MTHAPIPIRALGQPCGIITLHDDGIVVRNKHQTLVECGVAVYITDIGPDYSFVQIQ